MVDYVILFGQQNLFFEGISVKVFGFYTKTERLSILSFPHFYQLKNKFIHVFNIYLLTVYCETDTVLGTGDISVYKTYKKHLFHGTCWEEKHKKK